MAEWQPIETAPQDGTLVVVWNGRARNVAVNMWGDGWRFAYGCSECRDYISPEPTRWQPLPEPPEDNSSHDQQ